MRLSAARLRPAQTDPEDSRYKGNTHGTPAELQEAVKDRKDMAPKECTFGLVALLAAICWLPAQAQTDTDILNFALNLECLEGEFYNWAAGNGGLPASDRGGGPAPIGGRAASLGNETLALAKEIATNEKRHVEFLRSVLGTQAVACPQINLTAFSTAFSTAVAPAVFSPPFSPFVDDLSFLLATFLFEDIGASAYQGAAPLLSNKTYLAAAAGNFAVESYQAGAVRFILFNQEENPYQMANGNAEAVYQITDGLAALRAKLGGGSSQGVANNDGSPVIVPVDANSQTIPRNTSQIIAIGTGGSSTHKGLFFPNGLNGNIK